MSPSPSTSTAAALGPTQDLANYYPPTVTRILLALSWACMLLGGWYQYQFLDRPFDTAWLPALRRKRSESSVQSAVLIDQLDEKHEEDQSLSPSTVRIRSQPLLNPTTRLASLSIVLVEEGVVAVEVEVAGSSTSLTPIDILQLPHPPRSVLAPFLPNYNSRSQHFPGSLGAADPSNISVSPPRTVISDTTQTTRQRLGLVVYSNSGLIEEETEAMLLPAAQGHEREPHNPTTPISHLSSPGSTGLLTRLAHAFGDGSLSTNPLDLQSSSQTYHYSGGDPSEEQVLQSDAHRWASLQDRQSPYQHTGRLRRDLHSWTSDEPA
ncbi:hypothetical protein PSTT_10301 [Puccinia striiformis]|uniref:Uncharacterized protein n=1 Tax=Puccinia striiformis TaxID=27350 RepID=A0A2S4V503_9BASI|nr:hypothetical protein PSTT_10301 [Puccinia striiformis]